MTSRLLTEAEFAEQLQRFDHTAFRLELQKMYAEPGELDQVTRFVAGDPIDPLSNPGLQAWCSWVAAATAEGKRIERVRVHDDPLTDYQRWMRWLSTANVAAGESIRYMTRQRAHEIGLLPAAGDEDWWLYDSSTVMILRFRDGQRIEQELTTEPHIVLQACRWRDLAVHHSAPDQLGRVRLAS